MSEKELKLKIGVEAQNTQSIEDLAKDLENLADHLDGDLAPAAKASAKEMRELANQQAAIDSFKTLSSQVEKAKSALSAAEREAGNYGKQIAAAGPPTGQSAAHQERLQKAVEAARNELQRQEQALGGVKGQLQSYGIAANQTGAAQDRIRTQVDATRNALNELRPGYQNAAQGAAAAGGKIERTHRQIGEGVQSISQQLKLLQGAFLAFSAGQQMAGKIKDLTQTADAVNNLRSRIELVTGAGQEFASAWEGVQRVSLATHSALEDTGNLFARVAQAGKDAGLGTQQAIDQSLALTETINQAAQLSGASAQASSAAITQLIQALQSGVLRGDEFNSVMEQAPRLAQALANGLGVTTGELRKMAEAGSLSSQTVIAALQGQSDVVAREFKKLPPTVGRAMQDVSTQWQLYVGEVDKSTGASVKAANVLQALAGNMQVLGDAAMAAGKGIIAFGALAGAQHMLSLAGASAQAAKEMATMGTVSAATAAQAEKAAVMTSRLSAAMAGLRTFGLLTIAMNFEKIGTAIGESLAKMAGWGESFKKLEEAEARYQATQKARLDQQTQMQAAKQAEIDKQFELSRAAADSVAEFAKLTKEGASAAEAVKKVSAAFDLSKTQGIRDFAATLDKLVASGQLGAQEFKQAWAKALEGKDLVQFETQARAAFAGSAREGERLAQMLDATLHEAVGRTGLDFDNLRGQIGAAARGAINDVDVLISGIGKLKEEGVDVGRVLGAGLAEAIKKADTPAALDEVRAQVERVRGELGKTVADGLLDQAARKAAELKDKLDDATAGVNSLREAHRKLGLQSAEDLRRTASEATAAYGIIKKAGQQEGESFEAWQKRKADAAKVWLDKMVAANGGVISEEIKLKAAIEGVDLATKDASKSTETNTGVKRKNAQAGEQVADSVSKEAEERRKNADAIQKENDRLEELGLTRMGGGYMNKDKMSTDRDGKVIQAAGWTRKQIIDWLVQFGMDSKLAEEQAKDFIDGYGNVQYMGNAGQLKWAGKGSTLTQALSKMGDYFVYGDGKKENEKAKAAGSGAPSAPSSTSTSTSASAGGTGNTFVSNINLGGKTTAIKFADAQSQQQAESLLRELAGAKGASY